MISERVMAALERNRTCKMSERNGDLEQALAKVVAAAEHAEALGYFNENGSTSMLFKDALAELDKALRQCE